MTSVGIVDMRKLFGERVQENVILAPYTSARIGGPADIMITARTRDDLQEVIQICWEAELGFTLLGGGSNILVSDRGVRGIIILNKAKETEFRMGPDPIGWAASGVVLSNFAHRCAAQGLSGLEWAATVPGTIGGAVYGNAGAFGSDTANNLLRAELLTVSGCEWWSVDQMKYDYRSSVLKNHTEKAIVLSAEFRLQNGDAETITQTIEQFSARRKNSQPPGASMGSMFKNPPGDYAGRLIEDAGLKGTRIGNVEISTVHANFFINHGNTCAEDVRALIILTQKNVKEKSGINLDLEIEMIGEWE